MGRTSTARQRLILSALELMQRRSYASVGVQELCEHANVRKGSFYYFFPTKLDLALAALDYQWQMVREQIIEPILAQPASPLEQLEKIFNASVRHHEDNAVRHGACLGCTFGNLAVELSTQEEVLRERLTQIFDQWAGYFERLIAQAAGEGLLPPLDPAAAAQTLLAYLQGIILLAKARNRIDSMAPLMQAYPLLLGLEPKGLTSEKTALA